MQYNPAVLGGSSQTGCVADIGCSIAISMFRPESITCNLPGKSAEMADHELLQAAYSVREGYFIAVDANLGIDCD